MAVTPRDEQETIISYDRELDQWHYYSDVPKQNHKWDQRVKATRRVVEPSGVISVLEGTINGIVSIRKPVTEEQRAKMREASKGRTPAFLLKR